MFKFLLILSVFFVQPGFSVPVNDPATPFEALSRVAEPMKKWRSSGDTSAAAREKAFRERAQLARSFLPLFKIEKLTTDELYAYGSLAAMAADHATAEQAFAAYLKTPNPPYAEIAWPGLLKALLAQEKFDAAIAAAETVIDDTTDVMVLSGVDAVMQPLRVKSPAAARRLARRILAKFVENGGLKVSDADTFFAVVTLVNSLQTALITEDLRPDDESTEFLAAFIEKLRATPLARNKMLKNEVGAVIVRYRLLGKPAPPVKIIDSIAGGRPPEAFRGKIKVVDFLAHWCTVCIESFPMYNELLGKYRSKGVEVVGLSVFYGHFGERTKLAPAAEKKAVENLHAVHKVDYGFVFTNLATEYSFGVAGLPAVVVIDREGIVRFAWQGETSAGELERVIEKLLAE